jgi:hypothetical protein
MPVNDISPFQIPQVITSNEIRESTTELSLKLQTSRNEIQIGSHKSGGIFSQQKIDTILSNMNENKSNSPNEKHNFSSQSLQSTEHQVFDNSSPQEQKSLKTL